MSWLSVRGQTWDIGADARPRVHGLLFLLHTAWLGPAPLQATHVGSGLVGQDERWVVGLGRNVVLDGRSVGRFRQWVHLCSELGRDVGNRGVSRWAEVG